MLVISSFLQSDIKPLVARLIYDPNETNTINLIVDRLTTLGEQIQTRIVEGTFNVDDFQRYNAWLSTFLARLKTSDYVRILQGLHNKDLPK